MAGAIAQDREKGARRKPRHAPEQDEGLRPARESILKNPNEKASVIEALTGRFLDAAKLPVAVLLAAHVPSFPE